MTAYANSNLTRQQPQIGSVYSDPSTSGLQAQSEGSEKNDDNVMKVSTARYINQKTFITLEQPLSE